MKEKEIEKQLVKSIKKIGGMCIKINSLSMSGLPDRMILMLNGIVHFVELKAPNRKPRKLQIRRINQLQSLGFDVTVIDAVEQISTLMDVLKGKQHGI